MFKGFVKFNGYTVAISCINYAVAQVLERKVDGNVVQQMPWLNKLLASDHTPDTLAYMGLLVASIMLFMGIYWECKVLMIPFVMAYAVVLHDETGGTFRVNKVWELLFTFYAAICMVLLLTLGICACCRSEDPKGKNRKNLPSRCWSFFCCNRGCRSDDDLERDLQSQCSCETLNMRPAGPNDKHYHRVIFV